MARIVIDARRIRHGTGRYAHELLQQYQDMDLKHDFHVIIHDKDQGFWAPKADNFYLHVVPYDHYTFGEQLGFARYLRRLRPDLVHFTMPQQPLLYFGRRVTNVHDLTLVKFKNIDKNPLIYTIEQLIFKRLLKNVIRRSKIVIAISHYVKDEIAKYGKVSADKIEVTHLAATEEQTKEIAPIHRLDSKKFIFYVGTAFPHKNLRRLTDAHAQLLVKHPDLHLVIAGKKEYFHNQLEQYTAEKGYKHVHHIGYVSEAELAWLYKHAEAYVFPSLNEGFGLPGLEVMQHDTPLVSSNASCLPEIYGDAAHYFDPTSVEDMTRAVDEVLRSHTRQEELVSHGHKQLAKYSWTETAKKTAKLYDKALEI